MKVSWVFCFAVNLVLLVACGWGDSLNWQLVRTKHFLIYYTLEDQDTALRAGKICEKWYVKLSRKMEYRPGGAIPVFLYPDRRSFASAVGIDPSDSTVGIAHVRTRKVRIDASELFVTIEKVIPHELTHVFMYTQVRHNPTHIPLWFSEGLAKYFAEDWTSADAEILAEAAARDGLLPLREIAFAFPMDKQKRSIAYVQSYSFLKYIADQKGSVIIPVLLEALQRGESFESAFRFSVGATPEEAEQEWRQYLWEKYSLARWLRFFSGFVSVLMAVLVILAFRARAIYKRQKVEQMEEEVDSWQI
jgi:hypothetical protein